MTDVDLAAVNRHENRLWRAVVVLVGVVTLLAATVVVLVHRINTGVDLLEARTPIIERIDASENQNGCLGRVGLLFDLAVLGVLAIPPDERAPIIAELADAALHIESALKEGRDPCAINLPPILVLEEP